MLYKYNFGDNPRLLFNYEAPSTSVGDHLAIITLSFLLAVSWQVTMVPSLHMGRQAVARHSPSQAGLSATATEASSQGLSHMFLSSCKR